MTEGGDGGVARRLVLALVGGGLVGSASCSGPGNDLPDRTDQIQKEINRVSLRGGGVCHLPDGELGVRSLSVPSHVHLRGGKGSVLVGRSPRALVQIEKYSKDVQLSDFSVRMHPEAPHGIRLGEGVSLVSLARLAVQGSGARGIGIEVRPTTNQVHIHAVELSSVATGVRVLENARELSITECVVKDWSQRGLALRCVGVASRKIEIRDNEIGPCRPGGVVRQPIQFSANSGGFFDDVKVAGNRVTGPGTDDKDALNSGTADQISLHHCRNFTVRGNTVVGGGEVGITVSRGSRDGEVLYNTCRGNDSAGIVIGSMSGPKVAAISVRGNTAVGNGVNLGGSLPSTAKCGIAIRNASEIDVEQNTLGGGSRSPQRYGVTVAFSTSVAIGENTFSGHSVANVHRFTKIPSGEEL